MLLTCRWCPSSVPRIRRRGLLCPGSSLQRDLLLQQEVEAQAWCRDFRRLGAAPVGLVLHLHSCGATRNLVKWDNTTTCYFLPDPVDLNDRAPLTAVS